MNDRDSKPKESVAWKKVSEAFSDWLHLLDGPRNTEFTTLVEAEDWRRLFRLLMLVLALSAVAVGVQITLRSIFSPEAIFENQSAILFLIIGAMVAVAYNGIAYLFGVKMTVPKTFFLILSLGLPWLPVVTFIDVIPTLPSFRLISLVYILSHLILLKPILNFYQGVLVLTRCARWRVLLSILVPIVTFAAFLLYVF